MRDLDILEPFPTTFLIDVQNLHETVGEEFDLDELRNALGQLDADTEHRIQIYTSGTSHYFDLLAYYPTQTNELFNRDTVGSHWTRNVPAAACKYFKPKRLTTTDVRSKVRNAINEQRELWRVKPLILTDIHRRLYKETHVANLTKRVGKRKLHNERGNYGVYHRHTGWVVKPGNKSVSDTEFPYQAVFDGEKILLVHVNRKTAMLEPVEEGVKFHNDCLMVSDELTLLNDVHLFNATADLTDDMYPDVQLNLIQGVPGCGKTTYVLNNIALNDIALFATREGVEDFRERYRKEHQQESGLFERLKTRFRTIDSYLMAGVNAPRADKLIVDEAPMGHPGALALAVIRSGCKSTLLLGDVNQIPYINRMPNCEGKFHLLAEMATVAEEHSVTYRCTRTVAALLGPMYGKGMQSTSRVTNEMELKKYDSVAALAHIRNDKVLVFKQTEKAELERAGFTNVSTVHEYQGKQADDIHLVRMSTKAAEELYNRKEHCVVAVSRHRRSFIYYSAVQDDTISKWIKRTKTFSSSDYAAASHVLSVPPKSAPTLKGAGVFLPDSMISELIQPEYQLITSDKYPMEHDGIYDTVKFFDLANPPVRRDAELTVDEANSHRHITTDYIDQIYVCGVDYLQGEYDSIFPGHSIISYEFDTYQVHKEDLSLHLENIRFDDTKTRDFTESVYDKLRPNLRTAQPHNRPNTQIETLLAMVKRNMNVPDIQGIVDNDALGHAMWDAFRTTYFTDEQHIFEELFKKNPVAVNGLSISEWIEQKSAGKASLLASIGLDLPFQMLRLDCYDFMIKPTVKPQLDMHAPYNYAPLQTIAYQAQEINDVFCPIFREIHKNLTLMLKPQFKIFSGKSPDEFAAELNYMYRAQDVDGCESLEIDMSKYDKSQGRAALVFEMCLMRFFGVSEELIEYWANAHIRTVLRDRSNGVQLDVDYQRKSGDAATYIGNTTFLMAVVACLFDLAGVRLGMFSGDDSLLIGYGLDYDRNQECAALFNLESTFFRKYNYFYFCSKFLIFDGHSWHIIPDPVKLLTKLGRSDLVDWEHAEEYRISLNDLTTSYSEARVNPALTEAVNER